MGGKLEDYLYYREPKIEIDYNIDLAIVEV